MASNWKRTATARPAGAAVLIGVGVFFLILNLWPKLPTVGVPRTLLAGSIDSSRIGKAMGLLCGP